MSSYKPKQISVLKRAKFPCKDCKNRHTGCHDECTKYKESIDRFHNAKDETATVYKDLYKGIYRGPSLYYGTSRRYK